MEIIVRDDFDINADQIIKLYELNNWSAAKKPDLLIKALKNSDSLVTAWDKDTLVGLGNTISDGYLVVYYPHLLVHPQYHKRGIGKMIVDRLQKKYEDFHQHILVSDYHAIKFYEKCGFQQAGLTQAMWVYGGDDH